MNKPRNSDRFDLAKRRFGSARTLQCGCFERHWLIGILGFALGLVSGFPPPAAAAAPVPAPLAHGSSPATSAPQSPSGDHLPVVRIEARGPLPDAAQGQSGVALSGALSREIVDPCLGTRWRLIADAEHPERPGRLVLADPGFVRGAVSAEKASASRTPTWAIRSGDRLTVAQENTVLRARFQAVALESAEAGQTMRVRLIGGADTRTGNFGTVVEVRAIRPGEAEWLGVERKR